jgi:hypothetical protein
VNRFLHDGAFFSETSGVNTSEGSGLIVAEGPEDTTIRPVRPELRALLERQREHLLRWLAQPPGPSSLPPEAPKTP